MRIVASARWHRDHAPAGERVTALAPAEGETYPVWIPNNDLDHGTLLHLLWCPPFSEENGWDSHPSDIALSQIVTGRVRPPSHAGPGPTSKADETRCEVVVYRRMAILDCLQSLPNPSDTSLRPSRDLSAIWDHANWCGTAQVAGFTYLLAVVGEAQLELILKRHADSLTTHYEHYWLDGWEDSAIGSWPVTGAMKSLVEALLGRAQILTDLSQVHVQSA